MRGADPRFLLEKRSIPSSSSGPPWRGTALTAVLEMGTLLYSTSEFRKTHGLRGSIEDVWSLEQPLDMGRACYSVPGVCF